MKIYPFFKSGGLLLALNADWHAIDSSDRDDIEDKIAMSGSDKVSHTAVHATGSGMYAAGLFHGAHPKGKAYAFAAMCAQYSLSRKSLNAIYVFKNDEIASVVGVKNGMPFVDYILHPDEPIAIEDAIRGILSVFESGCTLYGDPNALTTIHIDHPIGIEDIAIQDFAQANLVSTTNIAAIMVVLVLIAAIIAGGANWYASKNRQAAMMTEAVAQAQAVDAERARNEEVERQKKIAEDRETAMRNMGVCSVTGANNGWFSMVGLLGNYGGYQLNRVSMNCASGLVIAEYGSQVAFPNLYVYKQNKDLSVDVGLREARLTQRFTPSLLSGVSGELKSRDQFVADVGTALRAIESIGIEFKIGDPRPSVIEGFPSSGELTIAGDARYLQPIFSRLNGEVYWKSATIERARDGKSGMKFNLLGAYYVK